MEVEISSEISTIVPIFTHIVNVHSSSPNEITCQICSEIGCTMNPCLGSDYPDSNDIGSKNKK